MKYYYRKNKRLLNIICLTIICYFISFYDVVYSCIKYNKVTKELLSSTILEIPRNMTDLCGLVMIVTITYLFFSYYLESLDTKFIYIEYPPNSNIYRNALLKGLSMILKINIVIYGIFLIILCFFYTFDFLSILYFLIYILGLTSYAIFIFNLGFLFIKKIKTIKNAISLCVLLSFLTTVVDILFPELSLFGIEFSHFIFNFFISNEYGIYYYVFIINIINLSLYLYLKSKGYLYLEY